MNIESRQVRLEAAVLQRYARCDPPIFRMLLPSMIAESDAHGVDIRDEVRRELETILDRPDAGVGDLDPHEAEIEALYREVHELASSKDDLAYREAVDRLRALETASAERMRAFFEAHRLVTRQSFGELARHAEDLLSQHEDPANSDRTR